MRMWMRRTSEEGIGPHIHTRTHTHTRTQTPICLISANKNKVTNTTRSDAFLDTTITANALQAFLWSRSLCRYWYVRWHSDYLHHHHYLYRNISFLFFVYMYTYTHRHTPSVHIRIAHHNNNGRSVHVCWELCGTGVRIIIIIIVLRQSSVALRKMSFPFIQTRVFRYSDRDIQFVSTEKLAVWS